MLGRHIIKRTYYNRNILLAKHVQGYSSISKLIDTLKTKPPASLKNQRRVDDFSHGDNNRINKNNVRRDMPGGSTRPIPILDDKEPFSRSAQVNKFEKISPRSNVSPILNTNNDVEIDILNDDSRPNSTPNGQRKWPKASLRPENREIQSNASTEDVCELTDSQFLSSSKFTPENRFNSKSNVKFATGESKSEDGRRRLNLTFQPPSNAQPPINSYNNVSKFGGSNTSKFLRDKIESSAPNVASELTINSNKEQKANEQANEFEFTYGTTKPVNTTRVSMAPELVKAKFTVDSTELFNRPSFTSSSVRQALANKTTKVEEKVRDNNDKDENWLLKDVSGNNREVGEILLKNLKKTVPDEDNIDEDVVDETREALTDGELRFQQHLENLKRKREMLSKTIPSFPEPAYRKNPIETPTEEGDSEESAAPKSVSINELKKMMLEKLKHKGNHQTAAEKRKAEKAKKSSKSSPAKEQPITKEITIPAEGLLLKDLAQRLSMKLSKIKHGLMEMGDYEGIDDESYILDPDSAELLALEFGCSVKRETQGTDVSSVKEELKRSRIEPPKPRPPIVCIMGHVDHGKTTLLDTLRKSNVAAMEDGGITQKLSAFTVSVADKKVVFLDTPGHAAFSAMRSSGADATDIVVLVVAMDDGVQPQTKEAIARALQAKRTIIVALNKVDLIPANDRVAVRARVLSQISELGVMPEDFGGDVQVVEISARARIGIDKLVESLIVQSDVMELTAYNTGYVEATVLGANIDKGRGVIVDAIVKEGKISVGDVVLVGSTYGKVKNIYDDNGKEIDTAGPAAPIRFTGLRETPTAGDEILGIETEFQARQISDRRARVAELRKLNAASLSPVSSIIVSHNQSLANRESMSKESKVLNIILKADSVGTLDALTKVIVGFSIRTSDVQVNIIDKGIGDVTVSDVERANDKAKNSMILGFNINNGNNAIKAKLKEYGIQFVRDSVIYRLEDALKAAMESKLTKQRVITREGVATVLKVFTMNDKTGSIVAGLRVTSGYMKVADQGSKEEYIFKLLRKGSIIEEKMTAKALKRFKDDVLQVESGLECGLTADNFKDFNEGDDIECYRVEYVLPTLQLADAVVFSTSDAKEIIEATA